MVAAGPDSNDTQRLRIRRWHEADGENFAALHADPAVMRDYGGPIDRVASDAKLVRYRRTFDLHGIGRWCVEMLDGEFLGHTGIMPVDPSHPLGAHFDIG